MGPTDGRDKALELSLMSTAGRVYGLPVLYLCACNVRQIYIINQKSVMPYMAFHAKRG